MTMSLATMYLGTYPSEQCHLGQCPLGPCPSGQLFLTTMSLATMSLTTIVPRDTCSLRQLFLATIVPCDNYSSVPLQMVVYKEDGPPDDKNQWDGGEGTVANDHLEDPATSVLFRSFANGHLQRGWFSG